MSANADSKFSQDAIHPVWYETLPSNSSLWAGAARLPEAAGGHVA